MVLAVPNLSYSQQQLKDIDTVIDYQQRFYNGTQLKSENRLLSIEKNLGDSVGRELVRDGLWIDYFTKNWEKSDSSAFHYYRLIEYDTGNVVGKFYNFSKNGRLLEMIDFYPMLDEDEFQGYLIVKYAKSLLINSVEYKRFSDDTLAGMYINIAIYARNGQLTGYSLSDDENHHYHSITMSKRGYCKYELVITDTESFIRKKRRNGRVEIFETKTDGIRVRNKFRKGKLMYSKTLKRRHHS